MNKILSLATPHFDLVSSQVDVLLSVSETVRVKADLEQKRVNSKLWSITILCAICYHKIWNIIWSFDFYCWNFIVWVCQLDLVGIHFASRSLFRERKFTPLKKLVESWKVDCFTLIWVRYAHCNPHAVLVLQREYGHTSSIITRAEIKLDFSAVCITSS